MTGSPKERGPVSTVVRDFLSALLVELLVIRGIFKDIFNFREETLPVVERNEDDKKAIAEYSKVYFNSQEMAITEQNEKDKKYITGFKEYIYWEPGGRLRYS